MVFTVTPRGTYDTRILLENPQEDFPRRLVEELPARFIADLKEAAKCLVFDIPVGCAFMSAEQQSPSCSPTMKN
jgi:hypothetical protein